MTAPQSRSLRLQHLWDASHALATTAPTVSAHLMAVYGTSIPNLGPHHHRAACTACGTLRPATGDLPRIENDSGRKSIKSPDTTVRVYKCPACKKIAHDRIPRLPKPRDKHLTATTSTTTTTTTTIATHARGETQTDSDGGRGRKGTAAPTAASTASRARKKAARKGASLSKMLAARRRQTGADDSVGLDLMDLMKTG